MHGVSSTTVKTKAARRRQRSKLRSQSAAPPPIAPKSSSIKIAPRSSRAAEEVESKSPSVSPAVEAKTAKPGDRTEAKTPPSDHARHPFAPEAKIALSELAGYNPVGPVKRTDIEFDYLVVESGYTSRLVTMYMDLGVTFALKVLPQIVKRAHVAERADTLLRPEDRRSGADGSIYANYARQYDTEATRECDPERVTVFSDETGTVCMPTPAFVLDPLCGDGLYLAWNENPKERANALVAASLAGRAELSGCIAYKLHCKKEAMCLAATLGEMEYCRFMQSPQQADFIEGEGLRLLVLSYDAESG